MLTHANAKHLLVLFRASFFCPNLAFCSISKALWKGPDCEKLKSMCGNLGAVYSSDVDGKESYEESLDCKMLVSSGVTWNYRVLKSWYYSNCFANNADGGSYTVFTASCQRSFSELKLVLSYLRASFINNKSGGRLCDRALMRIERDETAKAYFDEVIDEFASIKISIFV